MNVLLPVSHKYSVDNHNHIN